MVLYEPSYQFRGFLPYILYVLGRKSEGLDANKQLLTPISDGAASEKRSQY